MIKIVDCFIFYNEIELLTYRLNILNDVVDYFVIVESKHSFVGKEKQLYYNDNKHLFEKFNHKIIHIIVSNMPYKCPDIVDGNVTWTNEIYQRNCIANGINLVKNLSNDDVIIITDLDEIPNPAILKKIKNNEIIVTINAIELDLYYYNLTCKFNYKWRASKILSYGIYKQLNTTCNNIRGYPNKDDTVIKNAGWHLSYFGDKHYIKNKIQNFSHFELNKPEFTNIDNIQEKINKCTDLFDRDDCNIQFISIKDNDNLPVDYDIYLKNYICD